MKLLIRLVSVILLLPFICFCKSKELRQSQQCDFFKETGIIKVNYEYKYDIIPVIGYKSIFFDNNMKIRNDLNSDLNGIAMEIYNYGNDVKINNKVIDDIYSSALAPVSHFYVLEFNDIFVLNTFESDIYGCWAIGEVNVPDFNRHYKNVFISPLAYRLIQEPKNQKDDYLILVRLLSIDNNTCFNGIFVGDYVTKNIIDDYYSKIVTVHDISFCLDKSSCKYSSSILSEQEYRLYKSASYLMEDKIQTCLKR